MRQQPYETFVIVIPQDKRRDEELEPLVEKLERDLDALLDRHREAGLAIERRDP